MAALAPMTSCCPGFIDYRTSTAVYIAVLEAFEQERSALEAELKAVVPYEAGAVAEQPLLVLTDGRPLSDEALGVLHDGLGI